MHVYPLFAFGFESLPMLGWLLAAAAPWVIHLLTRRKHRETAWAAMDFLLAAVKRRARRVRLEQLLLLLLRTLIIAAIVVAVAEPYLERTGAIFSPGGSTHRVLVIDASYSMAYKAGDRSRFEQAKQWAEQIIEQSLPGDGFTLIEMTDPPRVVISTPALEAVPVRQEIENLELLHTGADVPATLAEVRKLIETARRDCPRLVHHEVYIFTDLQRASWAPAAGSAARANLTARAAELASLTRLKLIDLGQPGADNLAVTSLSIRQPVVLAGSPVDLTATLRDFGRTPRKQQAVELLIDGHTAGLKYVDVPSGGEASVAFQHTFTTPGNHAVELRAAGDALEIDNRRWLAVNVREKIRVLCVDGRPSAEAKKSSVFAVANALLAREDPDARSPVAVDVATEAALQERNLAQYDCVMLSDVALFTASEARLLDNYLGQGGSLVFFLGERVKAENYNSMLAAGPHPILPARLLETVRNPGGSLDPRDYNHPIVEPFRNQEKAQLLRAPIAEYFKVKPLEPAADEKAAADLAANPPQVALALPGDDPLIITRGVRRGRVVLVTTSADTSWSMLPTEGVYLPLVRRMLDWCLAGQARPRNLLVGDPLESSLKSAAEQRSTFPATPPSAPAPASITIERPDGHRRTVPLKEQGNSSAWSYDDTRLSGIYTAVYGPPHARSELFAVNVNTSESDLATISRDDLQNEVLPGLHFDYQTAWQTSSGPLTLPESEAMQLHVSLLYAVAGLLLLETILAWRMGYHLR